MNKNLLKLISHWRGKKEYEEIDKFPDGHVVEGQGYTRKGNVVVEVKANNLSGY